MKEKRNHCQKAAVSFFITIIYVHLDVERTVLWSGEGAVYLGIVGTLYIQVTIARAVNERPGAEGNLYSWFNEGCLGHWEAIVWWSLKQIITLCCMPKCPIDKATFF